MFDRIASISPMMESLVDSLGNGNFWETFGVEIDKYFTTSERWSEAWFQLKEIGGWLSGDIYSWQSNGQGVLRICKEEISQAIWESRKDALKSKIEKGEHVTAEDNIFSKSELDKLKKGRVQRKCNRFNGFAQSGLSSN